MEGLRTMGERNSPLQNSDIAAQFRTWIRGLVLALVLTMAVAAEAQTTEGTSRPWRLSEALGSDWLELSGHHRSRYETLDEQFRGGSSGSDQIWVLRTTLKAETKLDKVELTAEVIDSRQELADDGTPINTGIVNALELLQACVGIDLAGVLPWGGKGKLQVGRHTIDIGSRRLVARNRFRNTINNFTGISGAWTAPSGERVRVFYVLPVSRLPSDRKSLLDNDREFDEEGSEVQFWGLHTALPELLPRSTGEFYLFGLHEDDAPDRPTSNRNLYTMGLRFYRKPAPGQFDFELESVYQTGESRASEADTDRIDLDHFAHFQHVHAGYTFDMPWSPRAVLQFDYASGDRDPNDGDNNRFDTLYGARRFEFGSTGICGAFARSNLISPGGRLIMRLRRNLTVVIADRWYWLASDTDAWTTAKFRDVTGSSGSYLGNQAEVGIRLDMYPRNLRLETGIAHLFAGKFQENAGDADGRDNDTTYAYLQAAFTF